MKAQAKNELRFDGFTMTTIDLTENDRVAVNQEVRKLKYCPIFREVGGAQDKARLQAIVPLYVPNPDYPDEETTALDRLQEAIRYKLNKMNTEWTIVDIVVFKSLPQSKNGAVEEVHVDMKVAEFIEATSLMQVVAMVAIMPDTKLRVYRGCFGVADQAKMKDQVIAPGEMMIFRGDLAHCGLAYKQVNYRIHVSVGFKGTEYPENSTYAALYVNYDCPYCSKSFDTKRKCSRHKQICKKNEDPTERNMVLELKRSSDKVDSTCRFCNAKYSKKSSLRQHIGRKKEKNDLEHVSQG